MGVSNLESSCASARRDRCARWLGWVMAGALTVISERGRAEPADATAAVQAEKIRPWAAGVSESEQAAALELYRAGNLEFAESRFAQALAKYREAIRHWDHPAIRFNMAVCLINLDQPLDAKDNLERGLAFGEGPLGTNSYSQGLTYRKLLDAQLARVRVICPEPGTQVTLDGKFLFTGPGSAEKILLPGEHQVVATKTEFLTASKALVLVAGKLTTYDIRPLKLDVATRTVRRWAPWKSWAVLAGGGALGAVGAFSYLAARRDYRSYDQGIDAQCKVGKMGKVGCDAAMLMALSGLRHTRDRADFEQVLAFSLFAAGGAALAGGALGVLVNQPRVQLDAHHAQPAVALVPGGGVLTMSWGF